MSSEDMEVIGSFFKFLLKFRNKIDFTHEELESIEDPSDPICFTDDDKKEFSEKFEVFHDFLVNLEIENNLGLIFQLNHVRFDEKISLFIDQMELIVRRIHIQSILEVEKNIKYYYE